jgi:hypothetical protein
VSEYGSDFQNVGIRLHEFGDRAGIAPSRAGIALLRAEIAHR